MYITENRNVKGELTGTRNSLKLSVFDDLCDLQLLSTGFTFTFPRESCLSFYLCKVLMKHNPIVRLYFINLTLLLVTD